MTFGSGATIKDVGDGTNSLGDATGSIINDGTITVSNGDDLVIKSASFVNNGIITVDGSAPVGFR